MAASLPKATYYERSEAWNEFSEQRLNIPWGTACVKFMT